ncbi:ROK family protein [Botrimarina hoheduenensis]|uniref:Glucokinase n=1 Tax=Botrimarina hoheduenensis TaxID=2528000 RepID=A0A5C5VYZ4_9BACT|nr:ROK family protein [Botrimarina hoheduenensis]TWT42732.1 Glucokinase [Botrimarina hoheduenensis]
MPEANQAAVYAGIDIGGTNIKIGLVGDDAQPIAFRSIPTQQEDGPGAVAERVAATLQELAAEAGLKKALHAVGLASPGPMDLKAGMLLCPGNLPAWHNTPLRDLFAKATGLRVNYENDANAAAYGEYWGGAGAKYNSLVMVTLGTGVGGGIILNDRVLDGEHSCGGEIGHIIIDASPTAPLNSLGIRGSLEGYCGSYGVVAQARRILADQFVETSLRDSIEAGEELSPLLIANAAEAGDAIAHQIVLDTARYLAIGIVTVVHTIDPEAVVIGGSLTFGGAGHPLGERFLAEVRNQTRQRLIPSLRDAIAIDFAELGGNAGYIGAAGLARADCLKG